MLIEVQSGEVEVGLHGATSELEKTTGGTVTLSGTNTYGGRTRVEEGTLWPIGPETAQTPVAPLDELYAIGFRNPWKLSFDMNAAPGDAPYVADVGSHVREEVVRVEPGKKYAWPYRRFEYRNGELFTCCARTHWTFTAVGYFVHKDSSFDLATGQTADLKTIDYEVADCRQSACRLHNSSYATQV